MRDRWGEIGCMTRKEYLEAVKRLPLKGLGKQERTVLSVFAETLADMEEGGKECTNEQYAKFMKLMTLAMKTKRFGQVYEYLNKLKAVD